MVDYSKLKVTELKEELKKRGLPLTGLKAALVTRLTEADAQADQIQTTEGPPQPQDAVKDAEDVKEAVPVNAPVERTGEEVVESQQDAAASAPLAKDAAETIEGATSGAEAIANDVPVIQAVDEVDEVEHAKEDEAMLADISKKLPSGEPSVEPTADVPMLDETAVDTTALTIDDKPTRESEPDNTIPPPAESTTEATPTPYDSPALSAQSSLNKEEVLEDTRKRKRRSQSPPLVVETAQKRAKAEDGSPMVQLPEDVDTDREVKGEAEIQRTDAMADADATEGAQGSGSPSKEGVQEDTETRADRRERTPPPVTSESATKLSASDTRFKNLFTGPLKRDASPPAQPAYEDTEDRVVTPALHPATAALYIRNFMRPLQPGSLKDHLASLSTAANSSPKPDGITNFYLDPIRTHCLVEFPSISAASRVRSTLHDRVWPDERTRKPLWVDFVPEEKVKQWIDVEQNASSGRGQSAKRWEVVYEDEEGGIKAYLQETGAASRAGAPSLARTEPGRGVVGAPSGPRISEFEQSKRQPDVAPRSDGGKGFKALDDLFKSTAAKPKLYYLPVVKEVADKRLDKLAAGRGGGRGDGVRRFTFEDELIVDKGPEFGAGFRGGYRGRGGSYAGAQSARGGGWRSDTWRDRR